MENQILIQVDWRYVLGIIGVLVVLAFRAGGRFKTIETNIEWLKETVKDISNDDKVSRDNRRLNMIGNESPLKLLDEGVRFLKNSGLEEYIDRNKEDLLGRCEGNFGNSAYEIQEHVFDMFDNIEFDKDTDRKLKDYAYNEGINIETLRRIGAIYFRDICLRKYEMEPDDVDSSKPKDGIENK